ncbi:hypothetical protein FJY68_13840, partial [candidate division WOR-3 bacterium]|nr:hypothetical protein [candidate division WOR-3 bacterium]
MRRNVFAVLLAVAAVALAAKPAGNGVLPALPYDPATTCIGPALPADADPRVAAIRAEQNQAAARGDKALARELESKLQAIYLEHQPAPGSAENAVRLVSRPGESSFDLPDALIDTGIIWATAADYEIDGTMWVAYSKYSPDSSVTIVRSVDHGTTWEWVQGFYTVPTSLVEHLGIVVGQGDSGFVYVFLVHPDNDGDMICVRFNRNGSGQVNSWVKSGTDTINNFRVCRDYSGDNYGLYCVAGDDDHTQEMDDFLLRSLDYGKTWAVTNTFRYASDGSYQAGAGSYLYMSGRPGFSPHNGQLGILVNPAWGAMDSWREVSVAPDTFMVMDPVIAPSFVTPPESAAIWTLYSHNYEGTGDWDML